MLTMRSSFRPVARQTGARLSRSLQVANASASETSPRLKMCFDPDPDDDYIWQDNAGVFLGGFFFAAPVLLFPAAVISGDEDTWFAAILTTVFCYLPLLVMYFVPTNAPCYTEEFWDNFLCWLCNGESLKTHLRQAFAWLRGQISLFVVKLTRREEEPDVERAQRRAAEKDLMSACKFGHQNKALALLARGVDVNAKSDRRARTPLLFAIDSHEWHIVVMLITRSDVDLHCVDVRGKTALMYLACKQYSPLSYMKFLLQKGVDVNAQDTDGATALMYAAAEDALPHMKLLLEAGADVNAQESHGLTALMISCYNGQKEHIQALLSAGAAVGILDNHSHNALSYARRSRNINKRDLSFLIELTRQQTGTRATRGSVSVLLSDDTPADIDFDVLLGEGAFGEVFLGKHGESKVAVKIAKLDQGCLDIRAFQAEVGVMAILKHENIVRLVASKLEEGVGYIIMEYCDRGSLSDILYNNDVETPLSADCILKWMVEGAAGLSYLHSAGFVHRDVKPSNILIHENHVKLADFGIAKAYRDSTQAVSMTIASLPKGTLEYFAPEILNPDAFQLHPQETFTAKSDVYAFGTVMFECATSTKPYIEFEAQTSIARFASIVDTVLQGGRPRGGYRDELRGAYADLVTHCWRHDPNDRPTADEIRQALERINIENMAAEPV